MSSDADQKQRVFALYEDLVKTPCRFNYDELWDEALFRRCIDSFDATLREDDLLPIWDALRGPATWEQFGAQMKAGLPLWSRPGWKHELVGQPFDLDAALDQAVLLDDHGQDAPRSPTAPEPRARVVLLLFFLVGCTFCEPIYPLLAEIQASAPAEKLAVVASNYASQQTPTPTDVVRTYVRERKQQGGMPFDVYLDRDRSVTLATAKRTRIPFTPNVFLFVDGRLAWHGDPDPALEAHSGFRRAIAAALDETATAA